MKKKIFTLLLAVAASVGTMFAESGICGPSTTWRLSNDTLYLDGNGEVYGGYRGYLWGDFDNSKLIQITTLVIGENITFLGDQLCYGMNNLRSIVLNAKYCGMNSWSRSSAGNDGDGPFYAYAEFNITGQIQEVTIGKNVDTIFCRFFEGMSAIKNIHYYATNAYYKENYYSYDTPFYNASGISYIEIGENVQKLYPFNNRKENSDSTIIQYNAIDFQLEHSLISDPSKVKSIILGNKVKNIPNGFASSCSNVKSIILPNSIQSIGNSAFWGCTGLTSVTIPNSVTSIGNSAFSGCTGLTSVTIPNSVTNIGNEAFRECSGLTSVTIGNSVTSIGDAAFQSCSALSSIVVQQNNSKYDSRNNCNAIIETNSNTLLSGCKNTIIPNDIIAIANDAFYNCRELLSINLPNSITKIGKYAFAYCESVDSISIPNKVSSVEQSAFYGCNNLKKVIIGSSVKVLEESAFGNCSAIESITCYSQRPPTVNQNALYGLDYSTIVYVPADYLETYKMHDVWGLYDVRPLGAKSTETTDVNVTPAETTAEVAWPAVENAATYELVIKDKNGNVVCTLIFNANGQLTQIAFGAPARNNAAQAAGFAFTVTGLEEGTSYNLTITAKDGNGTTLDEKTIAFSTSGWTGVDALQAGEQHSSQILRNGQVLIIRDGKTYSIQGVEVK